MRLLLDTHTFIWSVEEPSNLGVAGNTLINDPANDLILSTVSIWEMAIKIKTGKLSLAGSANLGYFVAEAMRRMEISILDIKLSHALMPENLPLHHNDPFDRMLVSQCLYEKIPIISIDAKLDAYGITRIW